VRFFALFVNTRRPQDFSRGRRTVSYPKACIPSRFLDRFRDRRSIGQHRVMSFDTDDISKAMKKRFK